LIRKLDTGGKVKADTFKENSSNVRRLSANTRRRMARMNKYINQSKDESISNLIFKFKRDPVKVAAVKDLLARSEIQAKKLSEIKTSLIDIKLDLIL